MLTQWGGGAALAMEGGGGWRGAAAVRPARDKWVTAAPAGNRGGSHKHKGGRWPLAAEDGHGVGMAGRRMSGVFK